MDTKKIKEDFPQFESNKELVYLDSSATSLTPKEVIEEIEDYYVHYRSNAHRGLYKEAEKATKAFEEARDTVANFIGAHSDEIVFCSGATLASNMLLMSLSQLSSIENGGEILTTEMEHHAVILPLQKLAKEKEMTLQYIPLTKENTIDTHALKNQIHSRTSIVAVTLASNVTGQINDLKKISEMAHKVNATVVVDATAAVGHIPVIVSSLGADCMFFSGHKMCGPTGIGVLFVKRGLLKDLEPTILGGGIVEDVTKDSATWTEVPERFEAGTQNIGGAIGLKRAIAYLEHIDVSEVKRHTRELVQYAQERLGELERVRQYSASPEENVGVVSFVIDGVHAHDVAHILGDKGIAVRAGHHCALPFHKKLEVPATTRASFYVYNTKEDVDALVDGIKEVLEKFSKGGHVPVRD